MPINIQQYINAYYEETGILLTVNEAIKSIHKNAPVITYLRSELIKGEDVDIEDTFLVSKDFSVQP